MSTENLDDIDVAYRSVVDSFPLRLYHSCFAFCHFWCIKAALRGPANFGP